MAVPSAPRDGILVSFQMLTPEASTRVVENRRCREEVRAKAAMLRRVAKEAKEAKAKVGRNVDVGLHEQIRSIK